MVPARRYLVLVLLVRAWFTQTNCMEEPPESKQDKLYFRRGVSEANNNAISGEGVKRAYIGPITVAEPTGSPQHIPWWSSYTLGLVNRFKFKYHFKHHHLQFGFLYMGSTSMLNQNEFPLGLSPSNQDGTAIIGTDTPLSPASRRDYWNYVAARPSNVDSTMLNTEQELLNEMHSLWNSYQNHYGHPPNTIVLYTWMMPSPQSTELIIQHFNQAPFSTLPYKVVAYTKEILNSNLSYVTQEGNKQSRQRLNDNKITYWNQQCERLDDELEKLGVDEATPSDDNHVCTLSDTFQGCFVGCLGHDFCCSCKESHKASMNVAMANDLAKDCGTSNLKTCAKRWVQNAFPEHQSSASPCTDIETTRAKLLSCIDTCVGRPLSKPLDPLNPTTFPGYLEEFSDILKYAPVTFNDFCSDIQAEGYLCISRSANSFTAGNSPCRQHSVCAYQGYPYKWCWTDHSGNWDYCCTSACSYGNSDYMWCHSGTKWQYCGDDGDFTVKHRHCIHDYPCGMHQDKGKAGYYWCYVDHNKNWGYCCQPGDTCSKKRESYDWCYVGYKRKSNWQHCNTEDIDQSALY